MNRIPENTVLYVIVPCYNEAELLEDTAGVLSEKLGRLIGQGAVSPESKILFVNDGSTDESWELIQGICRKDRKFLGISLAKNRGHQNALYAGLMDAKDHSDITITIDADLQQDVEAFDRFLEEYYKGSEIVYGVRNSRDTDNKSKKGAADFYYSLMKSCGVEIIRDAADYRLLSKKAVEALSEYKESCLFLRGMIPDIGLKSSIVNFDVFPRKAGESKYTVTKMMRLAENGLASFTMEPIRALFTAGFSCVVISLLILIGSLLYCIIAKKAFGTAAVLFSVWLVGGLNLFALGIIGMYSGHAHVEAKHRPRYFISETCTENREQEE